MSQKCSFLAQTVPTHFQLLKRAIALPKLKKAQLKVRAGLNEREALGKVVTARPLNAQRKRVAFHMPLFSSCRSTCQKRQN